MRLPPILTRRMILRQIAINYRARKSVAPPIWTTRELLVMLVRGQ